MKAYLDTRFFSEQEVISLENEYPSITFLKTLEQSYDAEIAIVTPSFINQVHLDKFKSLKWVQLLTAGYDNADMALAKKRDLIVTNALDVFSIQIAEDVISKILLVNRQIKGQIKHMSKGIWQHIPVTHELFGATVGIIGTGSIGKEVAKRLKAFETHVIGYRKTQAPVHYFDEIYTGNKGLTEVIKKSDYLVIAIPLQEDTTHLLNKDNMKLLKHDVVIINVARGEIIDQDALIALLRAGKLRGVGLDVTSPEPLPSDHPLWTFDQVFITPHNASASPYMSQRLLKVVSDNVNRYINQNSLQFVVKND